MRNEGEEKLRSLGSNLTKIKKNLQKKRATMARAPPEVGEVATAPVTIVLPDGEVYGTSLKTESAEKSLRESNNAETMAILPPSLRTKTYGRDRARAGMGAFRPRFRIIIKNFPDNRSLRSRTRC